MFRRERGHWFFLVKAAISLALLLYLYFKQLPNLQQIKSALLSAKFSWVLLAASLCAFGYFLSSLRWLFLLRAQQVSFRLGPLAVSYLVGMFFSSFLPGTVSGDVVRGMDTAPKVGSLAKSMLIILVERLSGIIALLILAGGAMVVLGGRFLGHTGISVFLIILTLGVLAAVCMFFHPATRNFIPGLVESIPISSVRAKLQNVAQFSQIFIGRLHILAACIGISLILQVNVVLYYYLIGKALGIEIGWMNYFAIIPLSLMILMIPASINGIGIREQVFIFLFGSVGVSAVLSISLAWIAFGMGLAQAGLGGIVFMIRKRLK